MKLSTKIYVGYAIPALILTGIGLFALNAFREIDAHIGTIYDDRVIPLQQLKIISDQYAINVIDAVNKTDNQVLDSPTALQLVETAEARIAAEWNAYQQTRLTPEETDLAQEIEQLFNASNTEIAELKLALQNNDRAAIAQLNGDLYATIDPLTAKIQELIDLQLDVASQERAEAAVVYQRTRNLFIIILLLAVIAASPLGYWVSRTIIATIQSMITTLTHTSVELAATTEQQRKTANEQAAAVTEISTTMAELNASSQQSAQQAKESSDRASRALTQAERGSNAVDQTLTEMQQLQAKVVAIASATSQLQQHTRQIGSITALVSDIANQTNMLALNASIEAVQANSDGAGFSVIATEIRKLAQQSRASSERIDALIHDIQTAIHSVVTVSDEGVTTVQHGMEIALETTAAFQEIRQDIDNMAVRTQQIYHTSQEQASSINQVVAALSNLDIAARDTASSINQTQATTTALSQVATRLSSMV